MGAGKSTVGKLLASALDRKFIDTDQNISQSVNMTINDIFAVKGESFFRDLETEFLKKLVSSVSKVVSTGGGIIERVENRELLKESGRTVYLDVDWNEIKSRISDSPERPLILNSKNWDEIYDLFEKRLPLYRQADICIQAGGLSPEMITTEIIDKLNT